MEQCISLDFIYEQYQGFRQFLPLEIGAKDKVIRDNYQIRDDIEKLLDSHFESSKYAIAMVNAANGSKRYTIHGVETEQPVLMWQKIPYLVKLSKDDRSHLNRDGKRALAYFSTSQKRPQQRKMLKAQALLVRGYSEETIVNLAGRPAFDDVDLSKFSAPPCPSSKMLADAQAGRHQFDSLTVSGKGKFIEQLISGNHARVMVALTGMSENQLGSRVLKKLNLE